MISSKDSENIEKSLCASYKADNQYWICVIFRPSGSSALKTGTIQSLSMSSETLLEIAHSEHCVVHKYRFKFYHAQCWVVAQTMYHILYLIP